MPKRPQPMRCVSARVDWEGTTTRTSLVCIPIATARVLSGKVRSGIPIIVGRLIHAERTRVGHGDLVDLIRVKPNLALAAFEDAGRQTLLKLQANHLGKGPCRVSFCFNAGAPPDWTSGLSLQKETTFQKLVKSRKVRGPSSGCVFGNGRVLVGTVWWEVDAWVAIGPPIEGLRGRELGHCRAWGRPWRVRAGAGGHFQRPEGGGSRRPHRGIVPSSECLHPLRILTVGSVFINENESPSRLKWR